MELDSNLSNPKGSEELNKNRGKEEADRIYQMPLSNLLIDKNQPRKTFNNKSIEGLAKSIAENGVLQPIIVDKKDNLQKHRIIAGERRFRACLALGVKTIPAIIKAPVVNLA